VLLTDGAEAPIGGVGWMGDEVQALSDPSSSRSLARPLNRRIDRTLFSAHAAHLKDAVFLVSM